MKTRHKVKILEVNESEFSEYSNFDISNVSKEELDKMIDEAANMLFEDDWINSRFREVIDEVARDHGLKKIDEEDE